MVKIRLMRVGKKNQPSYRVVVANSRAKRNGRQIEILGHYNPLGDSPVIKIDKERFNYWISQGAQPTERVRILYTKSSKKV